MGKIAAFFVAALLTISSAWGEATEVRVAQQYGIGYLPLMVMEQHKLIEKYAQAAGAPVKVVWAKYPGGKEMNDALLAGKLDFASGGLAPLLSIWSSTKGSANVKGVGSMNTMPLYLNTRNPNIHSLRDFTRDDRIALPGVKTSIQAVTLEMAAAAEWGDKSFDKLDGITVAMSHPDATKALSSGAGGVTAHFSSPPFQYDQLKQSGVHTVTTSYEILGGASSFNLVWTTAKFHDANPKLYAAFASALQEAIDWIKLNKETAAELYAKTSTDKIPQKAIFDMLNDVYILFTMAPKNIYRYSKFMYRIGQIKNQPEDWQEVFFSNVHGLYGS